MRRLLLIALFSLFGASAFAEDQAPISRELLPDLAYVRLDGLGAKPTSARVIDARYPEAIEIPAATIEAVFTLPLQPTLVLLGADLPAWLKTALAHRSNLVMTLAAGEAKVEADITVDTTLADDRAAYDLLAAANDEQLTTLLGRNLQKRRFDERALLRARNGDKPETDSDETAETETVVDEKSPPKAAPEKPPIEVPADLVLQRAVQLYQGLRALGRW